jgi:hypothetical protein
MQKKKVRVRRRQLAPAVRLAPAPLVPPPVPASSDPFFSFGPLPVESPPSIAPGLPVPAAPSQPTHADDHEETQPTLDLSGYASPEGPDVLFAGSAGDGEIEFVFDNDVDGDYDPKLSDPS